MREGLFRDFDLAREHAASMKRDLPARFGLPAVGGLSVIAGAAVLETPDQFPAVPWVKYALGLVFVAAGIIVLARSRFIFRRAKSVRVGSGGVSLDFNGSRSPIYSWTDPGLRIELWDLQESPGAAELQSELRLLWAAPGNSFNLSPEAFKAIVEAARDVGMEVAISTETVQTLTLVKRTLIQPQIRIAPL
ncbi:MAG: hypothetical protein ACHQ2Y_09885 [Candidatus Lutacidiplasmatales archaeon]